MSRHANIAIFVPHIGCPNRCSFCNQFAITGRLVMPTAEDVCRAVQTAVQSENYQSKNTEIAFFGGSFTAIDRTVMCDLLKTAYRFVQNGTVAGIRLSTRPDAVDDAVIALLKQYGVTAVELGAQSMDNRVLARSRRGHTAEDVCRAAERIRTAGMELGLQMMTGLPGDSPAGAVRTAEALAALQPATARIYPTVVLKGTRLAADYKSGAYQPQSLADAVSLAARLYTIFVRAGISVIRLGLHSVSAADYVAGPWHPAFAELVAAKIYRDRAEAFLQLPGNYAVFVHPSAISQAVGQHRENLIYFKQKGCNCRVVGDASLQPGDIRIERTGSTVCF